VNHFVSLYMYQREKKLHSLLEGKEKQTTIGQMELLLIDTLTQEQEITVVLSIVKRTQLHRHCMLTSTSRRCEMDKRA